MKATYTTATTGITFTSERHDLRWVLTVRGDDGVWRVRNRSENGARIHNAMLKATKPYREAGWTIADREELFKVEPLRRVDA